jgi:hypothetical protein
MPPSSWVTASDAELKLKRSAPAQTPFAWNTGDRLDPWQLEYALRKEFKEFDV